MGERRTRPTHGFKPDPSTENFAFRCGLDLTEELEGWLDWCAATGRLYLDHQAGFRTWLRHAVQYGRGHASLDELAVPRGTPACVLNSCAGDGLIRVTYDDGTSGWTDCECRRETGTGVRPIVESEQDSIGQKEGTPTEIDAPNLTLFPVRTVLRVTRRDRA